MGARTAVALCAAVPCAAFMAACGSGASGGSGGGGDNGEAGKSAPQILTDASNCVRSLQSVHIDGTNTGAQTSRFSFDSVSSGAISGQLTVSGAPVQVVVVNGVTYINGGSSFWAEVGQSSAAASLAGKWIKVPSGANGADLITSGVTSLTNFKSLGNSLAGTKNVTKGSTTTSPDGRPAVTLTSPDGTLYVSTSGNPCPIYIKGTSSGSQTSASTIAFTNFNGVQTPTAPPGAISAPSPSA